MPDEWPLAQIDVVFELGDDKFGDLFASNVPQDSIRCDDGMDFHIAGHATIREWRWSHYDPVEIGGGNQSLLPIFVLVTPSSEQWKNNPIV